MTEETKRWIATVNYKSEAGIIDVEHRIEELEELHTIIERGPHWDTITEIKIVLNPKCRSYDVTVEEAEKM